MRYKTDKFSLPVKQCEKKRDPVTGELYGFEVPKVETKKALIIDDICDGGGTFVGIANVLEVQNLELYLYVTHGVFSKGYEALRSKFKGIYTTDTITKPFVPGVVVFPVTKPT